MKAKCQVLKFSSFIKIKVGCLFLNILFEEAFYVIVMNFIDLAARINFSKSFY